MKRATGSLGLLVLLIAAAALFIFWSYAVPVFEGPDEQPHWQYILYIHQNGKLPPYNKNYLEANQPPLYYLLVAPFAAPSAIPRYLGSLDAQGVFHVPGINLYEHSTSDNSLYGPLRTARLVTIIFSLLTVLVCYWIGWQLSGKVTTGWLMAGVVAFLPGFTWRGMNISNDALLTLLCALATFWIVRLAQRGFTWRDGLSAGIALGLAFLSRINAMILLLPFGLALILQKTRWPNRLRGFAVLGVTAVITAPWLIANQIQYGDPLAWRMLTTEISGPWAVPKSITSAYFITEFPGALFRSFIGRFGALTNVPLPDWIYLAFGLLILAAAGGLVRRVIRRHAERRLILVLFVIPLACLASIIYLNLTFSIPFGRYLFPALPAIAALVALGLEGLPGWSEDLTLITLVWLGLMNLFVLLTVVIPAHALGA